MTFLGLITQLPDGAIGVWLLSARECPRCHRMAVLVVNRLGRTLCVGCSNDSVRDPIGDSQYLRDMPVPDNAADKRELKPMLALAGHLENQRCDADLESPLHTQSAVPGRASQSHVPAKPPSPPTWKNVLSESAWLGRVDEDSVEANR